MCENEQKKDSIFSDNKGVVIPIVIIFIIVISIFIYFFLNIDITEGKQANISLNSLGTVGDYFGGLLNPIVAFFALLALLKTIRVQSKELKLSREAFEEQAKISKEQLKELRTQVKDNKKALDIQIDIAKIEQFESTFFHLLQMHRENIMSTEILSLDNFKDKKGIYIFSEINKVIKKKYYEAYEAYIVNYFIVNETKIEGTKKLLEEINQTYYQETFNMQATLEHNVNDIEIGNFFKKEYVSPSCFAQNIFIGIKLDPDVKQIIVSYLKSIDTIIQYIDNSLNAEIDKKRYMKLFFSSFSIYEIELVYNGLPLFAIELDYFDIDKNVSNIKKFNIEYELLNSPPEGFLEKPIHENLMMPLEKIV